MKVLENKQRNPTNKKLLNMWRNFFERPWTHHRIHFDICLFLKNSIKWINFDALDEY